MCARSILSSIQCPTRSSPASATFTRAIRLQASDHSSLDSLLEGDGFELVWGFSCQAVVFGFFWFFFGLFWFVVRSGKAVLRPVACDQVRGARGRGQGTETVAEL